MYADKNLVPRLFTQWWLYWNSEHPNDFPLPDSFSLLSESEITEYLQVSPCLPLRMNEALEQLWESSLRDNIELMLVCFFSRPKGRNCIQHPTPTADFAQSYLTSYSNLTEVQKSRANNIIENGKNSDGMFYFTPAPTRATSHNTGAARGTIRQREEDDDGGRGLAVKRLRQGE